MMVFFYLRTAVQGNWDLTRDKMFGKIETNYSVAREIYLCNILHLYPLWCKCITICERTLIGEDVRMENEWIFQYNPTMSTHYSPSKKWICINDHYLERINKFYPDMKLIFIILW